MNSAQRVVFAAVSAAVLLALIALLHTGQTRERQTDPFAARGGDTVPGEVRLRGARGPQAVDDPATSGAEGNLRQQRISGRVVSALTGEPVAGVRVIVAKPRARFSVLAAVFSGSDGRYRTTVANAGDYLIYALGAGWISEGFDANPRGGSSPLVRSVGGSRTEIPDLQLVAAARVSGRIVGSDGAPIQGVRVTFDAPDPYHSHGDPVTILTTTGGPDGRFSFDSLPTGGPFSLVARSEAIYAQRSESFWLAQGQSREVVISAPRVLKGRWLEVEVLGEESDTPLEGVTLCPMYWDGKSFRRGCGSHRGGRTGADGRARIAEMCDRLMAVRVEAKHYLEPKVNPVRVEAESVAPGVQLLTIRLDRGKAIRVRVEPPPGVSPESVHITLVPPFDSPDRGLSWSGNVDRDGAFLRDGLYPGRYRLYGFGQGVKHFERVVEAGGPELVIALEPAPVQDVTSEPLPTITVRVMGPAGAPVPQARYRLYYDYGSFDSGECRGGVTLIEVYDADAVAELEIWDARDAKGEVLDFAAVRVPLERAAGGDLHVTLRAGRRIDGRVVGPRDEPIPGALIEAVIDYRGTDIGDAPPVHARARAGADGAFTLEGLGDFAYVIRMRVGPNYVQPAAVPVRPPVSDLVLRQRLGVRPTVSVVDWQGEPLSGAIVWITDSHAPFDAFLGECRELMRAVEVSPKGTYYLDVPLDPDRSHALDVDVGDDGGGGDLFEFHDPVWAPVGGVHVVVPRGGTVSGLVLDAKSVPMAGVQVTAKWDGDDRWKMTDRNGRFRIRVPWGEVEVSVKHPGTGAAVVPAHAGDTDLEIVLSGR